MHYQVGNYLIKSELAAKPIGQANRFVLEFIYSLPKKSKVLDYGCGKLRYSIPLAQQVYKVVGVDSSVQLEKWQTINGVKTTVKEYGNNFSHNLSIVDLASDTWKLKKYDIVFCTNVLSAIPDDNIRLEVLTNAKQVLSKDGYVFISVQYRNSYFSQYSSRNDTKQHLDGWLIIRKKRSSFYGIITKEKIQELCKAAGLSVFEIIHYDGSMFVKAR